MGTLLEDLLEYSKVGSTSAEPIRFEVTSCLDEIVTLLSPKPGITVRYDDSFPVISSPKAPFETVMRNLIGNSLKHHDKNKGLVTIDYQTSTHGLTFAITDDGPGIATEFQTKVFELFQTLKPRSENEGSGMGLALVKKTVENCGGSVTLSSQLGYGTKVEFNWPCEILHE